ncbi:NADPH-dependent 2,4-dienoyl-CoA reductase/sulfur reductase-like enzyme [Mycoplasma testudineum]|uniref:NADPH-dependent 2,4-dienoyl-CoA reductase/sulfur reductase-like enzyme n=1 Tax=Mycoplasma testudineum TaxID=244584 RepID=A0A4R6IDA8_9MOLU|nr:FAD-dependent oxidoreductase [Mycoplasma testudineum]OYD26769.1 NADH oxidase [Mycoplasma testudineum]TDO19904.1 NADPH-dependent 2,4-dienoyl-CoA reductase/sulfur reductase-like enzyme [Mycoplasma testudineum]
MKIILVGANHAGTSFVRTFKQLDPSADVVIYERNDNTSFLGCGIALWVGGEFENPDGLFYSSPDKLAKLAGRCDVNVKHDVTHIDYAKKEVTVKDLTTGKEFKDTFDKLVFAGGTWPILPKFEGIDYDGIVISKTFQHAQKIKEEAEKSSVKKVAVIGAGYIGVELAEAFIKHGKESVYLIDLADRVVNRYFDPEFTEKMQDQMKKQGLKLHLGEKLVKFTSKDGKNVSEVVTDKGSYPVDLVIMSVGFKPNTELFEGFDKVPNGALKVNEYQQLLKNGKAVEDIYGIGDSVALYHTALKDYMHVALATNAVKTGLIAAFSLAKKPMKFPGVAGTNAISVFGCHYSSTGFTEESAKALGLKNAVSTPLYIDSDRPEFMKEKSEVGIKIVYDKETLRLIGAQVGSWSEHVHTEVVYMFALAIQKGLTLLDLALLDYYFLPHLNKPFNFIITPILTALGLKY